MAERKKAAIAHQRFDGLLDAFYENRMTESSIRKPLDELWPASYSIGTSLGDEYGNVVSVVAVLVVVKLERPSVR